MKKWFKNNWLSLIAILLAIIAICLSLVRIEPINFNNGSMVSFVVGLMGICATIMVGIQIYSIIYAEEKIRRKIDTESKRVKYESDSNVIKALFKVEIITANLLTTNKDWDGFIKTISLLCDYAIDLNDTRRATELSQMLITIDDAHLFYNKLSSESKKKLNAQILKLSRLTDNPKEILNRFT